MGMGVTPLWPMETNSGVRGRIRAAGKASEAEHVSGAENGAERAKTRVERSGAVSGAQKNRAERSVSGGTAERERSGERTKSAARATASADILLFSLSSRDTN